MLLACGGVTSQTSGDEGITSVSGSGTSAGDQVTSPSTTSTGPAPPDTSSAEMTTGPMKDVGADDWNLPRSCGALDIVLTVEQTIDAKIEVAYNVAYDLPAGIEERLPGWSVHYLQVPGVSPAYAPHCEQGCLEDGFCEASPGFPCELLGPCDWVTGAGLMWRALDEKCIEGPQRWIDAAEDDASEIMHCMWKSGLNSGSWGALGPALASVSPTLTKPDGCNAGFLREDAWLLPVIVSHGYPNIDGDPVEWAASLAAAKGGDATAVVPVAILDPQTNPSNPPGCQEGQGDKTNGYHELVEQFPVGVVGDLCKPFTPPILEAIEHIAEVCKAGEIPD